MVCGACGSASEHETFCPGCGLELSTLAAEPVRTGSPSQDALPEVDATMPRCPTHADIGASATCRRCGRFVCARCTPAALEWAQVTCPECDVVLQREARPARLKALGAQLITSWALVAVAVGVTLAGLVLLTRTDVSTRTGVVVLLGPALAALVLCTALFAATRRLWLGWVATVTESLMLVPLWITNPSLCTAVLAAAPIFSVVRLLQMRELEQRLAAE
ncbi:MAG: hypothetical protein SFW67_22055 [Myxococcaceae bacterium]|nr:hypothetical protein [Myxococcaceae bacterium]